MEITQVKKKSLLVIVTGDPRFTETVAEALRLAAGVAVWKRFSVNVCLIGPAVLACGERADDLPQGKLIQHFIPMIRESGGEIFLKPDDQPLDELDPEWVLTQVIKVERLAKLAADADRVFRF